MSMPRFSVVIPTRERAVTLRSTLRCCVKQDFDDFEIVVGDNFSSAETAEVIREMGDPRIRHVRSDRPLAMSANWELALRHAWGEYLLILGDDDGLIPQALREIDSLLRRTGAMTVHWTPAFYTWPSINLPGQGNYLCVPFSRQLRQREGRAQIREVLRSFDYNQLPMLYSNAVVHRDLVDRMRSAGGRVFPCRIPDVYTAFVLGYLAGSYPSVTVPMSVSGLSGKSNGIATVVRSDRNDVAREFHALNDAFAFPPHPWVPDLPLFPIAPVAESFYRAKELYFASDTALELPRRTVLEQCVKSLRFADDQQRRQAFDAIRNTALDDAELLRWFDTTYPEVVPAVPPLNLRPQHLGGDGENLHLDTTRFGVTDVEGAADLVSSILGLGDAEFRYDLRGRFDEARELIEQVVYHRDLLLAEREKTRELELERERSKQLARNNPLRRLRRMLIGN